MKTGIELIAKERQEQIEKHSWDITNNADYGNEELLKAALFCIDQKRFEFPFEWHPFFREKILNNKRIDQLKKAGEIGRASCRERV